MQRYPNLQQLHLAQNLFGAFSQRTKQHFGLLMQKYRELETLMQKS